MSTSNEALFRTGTHNTIDEIVSVHLANQIQRLRSTEQGRNILSSINFDPTPRNEPQEVKGPFLDRKTRDLLKVAPLPRNMDPERNEDRRRQRVNFLQKLVKRSPTSQAIYYVDISSSRGKHSIVVLNRDLHPAVACILKSGANINTAGIELHAIARAIRYHDTFTPHSPHGTELPVIIFTDSQEACRQIILNNMHKDTADLFNSHCHHHYDIIWTPGHAEMFGNVRADTLARELRIRAPNISLERSNCRGIMNNTLRDLKLNRRELPPPHPNLDRQQSVFLRRAQTNTTCTPARRYLFSKGRAQEPPVCKHCGGYPNQQHVLWECPHTIPSIPHLHTATQLPYPIDPTWLTLASSLASSSAIHQKRTRAEFSIH